MEVRLGRWVSLIMYTALWCADARSAAQYFIAYKIFGGGEFWLASGFINESVDHSLQWSLRNI